MIKIVVLVVVVVTIIGSTTSKIPIGHFEPDEYIIIIMYDIWKIKISN